MTKTRAIRLSQPEDKLIEEFLKNNTFFDFSSLARAAIISFIKNPRLEIRPVKPAKSSRKENEHGH